MATAEWLTVADQLTKSTFWRVFSHFFAETLVWAYQPTANRAAPATASTMQ